MNTHQFDEITSKEWGREEKIPSLLLVYHKAKKKKETKQTDAMSSFTVHYTDFLKENIQPYKDLC